MATLCWASFSAIFPTALFTLCFLCHILVILATFQTFWLLLYYYYAGKDWRREEKDRGWDVWMTSLTQWTWVWVDSGSWWWTGRPGMLRFMGSQWVRHDWEIELNWTSFCLAVAAVMSRQSCPTPCNPVDGSPPGSSGPGILQARTLEWVAISFSNAWKWKVKVNLLSLSGAISNCSPLFLSSILHTF